MAIDPNPSIRDTDGVEVPAINYGLGDAGTYKTDEIGITGTRTSNIIFTRTAGEWVVDAEIGKYIWAYVDGEYNDGAWFPIVDNDETTITITGVLTTDCNRIQISTTEEHMTEYHIWNDWGMEKGSSKMISVRVSARDDNGDEVKNITKQHWVEIKSLTIHAGINGGDIGDETDDNMTEFQPVGLNAPLAIGDIPADCYRKIMVRVKLPNSAIEGAVTFQIYVVNQEPSTPIAKWTTGLHGNGVVYQASGAFAVSIGEPASILDIEKGFALIDNLETYYGAAQQYSVAALSNGTYKLYLTSVGVISVIISTSSIPSNSIELSRVVVSGAVATGVTDKRLFLTNVMTGLDAAKTATPTKNQVYIATDTAKLYICFIDDEWTEKTGTGISNIVEDTTPELGGELNAGAHSIGFTLQTDSGIGEKTIDWKLGIKFKFTFGEDNVTFIFTAPSNPCNLLLMLVQDGNGSRTITWPITVKWPAGTKPTLTTTGNAVDIITFFWDGTNYHGASLLAFAVPA